MAQLHLQEGKWLYWRALQHGREKLHKHQCLDGFARTAQPRSRVVFFNSEGNDLVLLLDFSSLDVLEAINSKPSFFQSYVMHPTVFLTGV